MIKQDVGSLELYCMTEFTYLAGAGENMQL